MFLGSQQGYILEINVVGLIGVIGSGKSFRQIEYQENNYLPVNFADSPKEFLWNTIGWKPGSLKEEREFKDAYTINLLNSLKIKDTLIHSLSGREVLVNFAENMKSLVGKDVWVEQTLLKIKRGINKGLDKFVIGDVRFYNEIEALKDLKVYREKEFKDTFKLEFIFCNYKSQNYKVNREQISESLAIQYLDKGYKDGEIIEI